MLTTVSFYWTLLCEWCDLHWKASILQPFLAGIGALCTQIGVDISLYKSTDPENVQLLRLHWKDNVLFIGSVMQGQRMKPELSVRFRLASRFCRRPPWKLGLWKPQSFPKYPWQGFVAHSITFVWISCWGVISSVKLL